MEAESNTISRNSSTTPPFVTLDRVGAIPLKYLRWGIFIDDSGSTGTKINNTEKLVLDVEKEFGLDLIRQLSNQHRIVRWSSTVDTVQNMDEIKPNGGTQPKLIFDDHVLDVIKNIDVALLITDGQIPQHEVTSFGHKMVTLGVHLKAIIGVIVGKKNVDPSNINVSVLVPAMISNACILYHNGESTSVMWACGAFKSAWNPIDIDSNVTWDSVTTVGKDNVCSIPEVTISQCPYSEEQRLFEQEYIPFGSNLFFNPKELLNSHPTWDELQQFPFDRICQYFKVADQYNALIDWFKAEKDRFLNEFLVDENEQTNFETLFNQMNRRSRQTRTHRNDPNLKTYVRTRDRAIVRRYIASDTDIDELLTDERAIMLMKFFRTLMKVMEEDVRDQYSNSSYTTTTISSTRYTSYQTQNTSYSSSTLTHITAPFNEPHNWLLQLRKLYPDHSLPRHECSVCCEESVPFVLFRKSFNKDQIESFLIEPFSYYYPQILCSKCADFFCLQGIDPVRESCVAAVPLLTLTDYSRPSFLTNFCKLTNYSYQLNYRNYITGDYSDLLTLLEIVVDQMKVHFSESVSSDTDLKTVFEGFRNSLK